MAMIVELFVGATDDPGRGWRLKLHIPMSLKQKGVHEQFKLFKNKWDFIRPYVPIEWSDKYYNEGELLDGVYAEIHTGESKDVIPALETEGLV
eukprot:5300124-Prorocentrum_lima.AAC.1